MSIGYFYNLHVNFEAFLHSVMSVKMHSPGSKVIAFVDSSVGTQLQIDYLIVLSMLKLPAVTRQVQCSYIDKKDGAETNTPKMKEYFTRLYEACKILDTEWLIRMEDDVHLRHPIRFLPDTSCAGNHSDYGMGGGSIFKRQVFIDIYESLSEDWIDNKIKKDGDCAWAADGMLRQMFTEHGHAYSKWIEIVEDWQGSNPEAAVHHGSKTLYDKKYLEYRGL